MFCFNQLSKSTNTTRYDSEDTVKQITFVTEERSLYRLTLNGKGKQFHVLNSEHNILVTVTPSQLLKYYPITLTLCD